MIIAAIIQTVNSTATELTVFLLIILNTYGHMESWPYVFS